MDEITWACGCITLKIHSDDFRNASRNKDAYVMHWCPLHKNAQDLLAICERMLAIFDQPPTLFERETNITNLVFEMKALVDKAKGEA